MQHFDGAVTGPHVAKFEEGSIGGHDAPVRARLAAAFIMGMEVNRELNGGQTLTREQSENMHARMAAILQEIIDG